MTASAGFIELLKDLLAPLGVIMIRKMFGGAGVYADGVVFAFIDQDALFLKTDEAGRAAFEAAGMGPFTYTTKHGPGTLPSYWRMPERLLDEPDEMVEWARRAIGVACRGSESKSSSGKPRASKGRKPAGQGTATKKKRS